VTSLLSIEVASSDSISPETFREICDVCTAAYREDFVEGFRVLGPGVHVIGRLDDRIVSHAMWVDRALQPGTSQPLRTAYVEAVATDPAFQRRGFASQVLRRVAEEIRDYELGALSSAVEALYERIGWELWRGPLFIRTPTGRDATPGESVMILRVERTPADLDLDAPLSAEWRLGELW
jgi:aminoglycoside 2'-N-acetyltransferase I